MTYVVGVLFLDVHPLDRRQFEGGEEVKFFNAPEILSNMAQFR
jgi:hypothetical protein